MKNETVLKINNITKYEDAIELYGKKTIAYAIAAGCWSFCSTIAALRVVNDDYRVLSAVALGASLLNVVLNSYNLKGSIKERNYYKNKLQSEIDNEEDKVLKKGL